jgi:hypothetical protein
MYFMLREYINIKILYFGMELFNIHFSWICVAEGMRNWYRKQQKVILMPKEIREEKIDDLLKEIADAMKDNSYPSWLAPQINNIINILEE